MTLSSIYGDVVRAWLSTNNNMTEECRTIDRREKDQKFKNLDKDARLKKYRNGKQIENLLKGLLLANRNGLIQPEKTKHGLEQGVVGEETSCQGERLKTANASHNPINGPISNPKYNPINNPKYRKRKQDECRTAHVLELS